MNQPSPPSVDTLPEGNDAVRAYADLFAAAPSSRSLIANLDTRLETVCVDGGWRLPVSVNDGSAADNCYFCSPRAQYVDYAAFELSRLGRPIIEIPLRGFLTGAGALFRRAALDRVVIVNNWLLSTNLYPTEWHGEGLGSLVASLIDRYPDHAVVFRSINARQNARLLPALRRAGARLLASRIVWHYDGAHPVFMRTSDARRDRRLLEGGPWEIVHRDDLRSDDIPDFTRLYGQLYLHKYTSLNPRYTAEYFAACHALGLLRFHGLRERETGRWLGMLGVFERDGVLTAPVVGYDTSEPQKRGLYRALMALVMREAVRRGTLLNLSAGAGSFKQLRGGEPCVEFTAVFDAHLPRTRRWPWRVLEELSNRVGLPMAWRKEVKR